MSNPADDGYAHAVIETVRDMQHRLEEHKRAGDESRAQLLATVEGIVAALRKDVHATIASLQISIIEDGRDRAKRQQQVDEQFTEIRRWLVGALIGIGLIIGGAITVPIVVWIISR